MLIGIAATTKQMTMPSAPAMASGSLDLERLMGDLIPKLTPTKRHELRHLVRGLKTRKEAGGIPSVSAALVARAPALVGAHLWRACVEKQRREPEQQPPQGPQREQLPRLVLANFGALPRDALCHISSFLHCHELLDIRCQSKHLRDAIRYAAGTHVGCSRVLFRRPIRYGEMHMEARVHVARAFGHTCRHLRWTSTRFSDKLGQSFPEDEFEDELLVEWCRTAPNLVRLDASDSVLNMERAAAIGRACPLLEDVKFNGWDGVSPAESWAKCFPKLRQVHLSPYAWNEHSPPAFVPTDLAAISETLRVCASAVELYCDECQISRPVVDLFIGTPFGNRLRALSFCGGQIDAGNLLACARGLPQLRGLALPTNELVGGVSFYEALARARPELAYLEFYRSETTEDSHVVAACSLWSLRCLVVEACDECGDDGLVDGILDSSSAASLEEIYIDFGEDILRLVRGCPRLRVFHDFDGHSWVSSHHPRAQEARRIVSGRGGPSGSAASPHITAPNPGHHRTIWSSDWFDAWGLPHGVRLTKYSTP